MFIAENRLFQHFKNDLIGRKVDLRRFSREFLDNVKGKRMKSADFCRDPKSLIDPLLQLTDGFSRVGNHNDFFRMDPLLFHQVFDLCCHRGGLACTCSGYQQTVVIIRNNCTALLFIQPDHRIDIFKNVVKVILFPLQDTVHIDGIMCDHIAGKRVHFGEECLQCVNIHPK